MKGAKGNSTGFEKNPSVLFLFSLHSVLSGNLPTAGHRYSSVFVLPSYQKLGPGILQPSMDTFRFIRILAAVIVQPAMKSATDRVAYKRQQQQQKGLLTILETEV